MLKRGGRRFRAADARTSPPPKISVIPETKVMPSWEQDRLEYTSRGEKASNLRRVAESLGGGARDDQANQGTNATP